MNAKDYASQLLRALEQAKLSGIETFTTDYLMTYLKGANLAPAGEPTAADIDH